MTVHVVLLPLIAFYVHLDVTQSSAILAILPFHYKSHHAMFRPLLSRLAYRGHNVTFYTPFLTSARTSNYSEIDTSECFAESAVVPKMDEILTMQNTPEKHTMVMLTYLTQLEDIENCDPLMSLLNSYTDSYDLLITETFNTDVPLMFANKFKIPFVTFFANSWLPWLTNRMGNPSNPAYIPHMSSGYTSRMSFLERVHNSMVHVGSIIAYDIFSMRKSDALIRKVLGDSAPSIYQTVRNPGVMFVNAHFSYNSIMPLVPRIVAVGGMHILKSERLPEVCNVTECFKND